MATAAGRTTRAAKQTTEPRTKVRWSIVALCFLGLTINYVDRANLSVALPQMSDDLGLGAGAEGLGLAAFFASYAIFRLPAGHCLVSDALVRRGYSLTVARKIPLVGGMLFASVIALAVVVPSAGLALALPLPAAGA